MTGQARFALTLIGFWLMLPAGIAGVVAIISEKAWRRGLTDTFLTGDDR